MTRHRNFMRRRTGAELYTGKVYLCYVENMLEKSYFVLSLMGEASFNVPDYFCGTNDSLLGSSVNSFRPNCV